MDWVVAIDRNQRALLRLVAILFAAAGYTAGGPIPVLSRSVRASILFILRPAESAGRRLIVIYHMIYGPKGLVARRRAKRAFPSEGIDRDARQGPPAFPLFDIRKCFDRKPRRARGAGPQISGFDEPRYAQEEPSESPDAPVDASHLCGRLLALKHALEDLPKQALRLARALARRQLNPRKRSAGPLRANKPPGHRQRQVHEIDEILSDCDLLARMTPPLDSS